MGRKDPYVVHTPLGKLSRPGIHLLGNPLVGRRRVASRFLLFLYLLSLFVIFLYPSSALLSSLSDQQLRDVRESRALSLPVTRTKSKSPHWSSGN